MLLNYPPRCHRSRAQKLQERLGTKTGAQLWDHSHGRDARPVEPPKPRKSVGAEVNWGVRFDDDEAAARFLDELAGEVGACALSMGTSRAGLGA